MALNHTKEPIGYKYIYQSTNNKQMLKVALSREQLKKIEEDRNKTFYQVDNLFYKIISEHFHYLPISMKEATLGHFIECHVKGTTDIENEFRPKSEVVDIHKFSNVELGKHGESVLKNFINSVLRIIYSSSNKEQKEKLFGNSLNGKYGIPHIDWFNEEKESWNPCDIQINYPENTKPLGLSGEETKRLIGNGEYEKLASLRKEASKYSDSYIDKVEVKTTRFEESKFFYFSTNEIAEMLCCYGTNHKYIIARAFPLDKNTKYEGIQIDPHFGAKFYYLDKKDELEQIYEEFKDRKIPTTEVSPKFFKLLGKQI